MQAFSGIDLLEIERLRQLKPEIMQRFRLRVYTPSEREYIGVSFERTAGLFCAKEAAAKAFGCGIGPVSWQELEIWHTSEGSPRLRLHGNASALAQELGIQSISVSISHTRQYASALVFAIGER